MNEPCGKLLNSKLFMLDMLYSQNKKPSDEEEEEEEDVEKEKEKGEGEDKETQEDADVQLGDKQDSEHKADKSDHHSNIRPLAERFGNLIKDLSSIPPHHDVPANEPPPPPPKKESDSIWDQLLASPRELRIGDINFTDLTDEDDKDILDAVLMGGCGDLPPPPPPPPCILRYPPPPPMLGCCPPPPPCFGATNPAPPPSEPPLFNKKKKTIRLFWSEVSREKNTINISQINTETEGHTKCPKSIFSMTGKIPFVLIDLKSYHFRSNKTNEFINSQSQDILKRNSI